MNKIITCGFIGGMLVCLIFKPESMNKFNNIMDDNLKNIYLEISNERMKNYVLGAILGIIIALSIVGFDNLWSFLAIVLTIQYFFYQLNEKHSIVVYLDKKEDRILHNKLMNDYIFRSHIGFIIGVIIIYYSKFKE